MNIDLTQIILAIIALLGSIITYFVVPILQAKLNSEKVNLSENQRYLLNLAVRTAVEAAEMLYKSDEGQKKKAYVLSVLAQQGYKADSAAIDAAIESAVLNLKKELYKEET